MCGGGRVRWCGSVGFDVHVRPICTNRMERTYNFHPALINVMMHSVLVFKQKNV